MLIQIRFLLATVTRLRPSQAPKVQQVMHPTARQRMICQTGFGPDLKRLWVINAPLSLQDIYKNVPL